jgi:hypothetical protein
VWALSNKGLKVKKDGTIDICIGPEVPKGWEANWVPAGQGQEVLFAGPLLWHRRCDFHQDLATE